MTLGCSFEAHEAYMNRLSAVSGIPLVQSIEKTRDTWALRKLSRSEFEVLQAKWQTDPELATRWLNRMRVGYDREKTQVVMEIEEIFEDIPCADRRDCHGRENAA
jgi:hypothetical protein